MSQAEFKRRLKALMLLPENQVCSDCPERQPRWASLIVPPPGAPPGSLPMGAFCCLECSGSHRRLGVHISFVRSINLDSWKEKEVMAMENGGNAKVNAIFEARLNVAKPPNTASGPVRERFIRDKYERRKFYDPSAFDRVASMGSSMNGNATAENPEKGEQEKVIAGVQRRLASGGGAAAIRKPSDAARKRVEERAARNRAAGVGAVRSSPTKTRTPVAAPAPPPAPVADLLDFGDFDSPEATSAVAAATAPTPAASGNAGASNEPVLDMFSNMSVNSSGGADFGLSVQQPQQAQEVQKKKMTSDDIMAMFNAPNPQQNPVQQNMYGMSGAGMNPGMNGMMGMGNSGNPMGNNMMMNTNSHGVGMMNNMSNNMMMSNVHSGGNNMGSASNNNSNTMMMNPNGTNGMFGGMGAMSGMSGNNSMMMMNGVGATGVMSPQFGAPMGGNPSTNNMMMQQQQQYGQMSHMNSMMSGNIMMMQGGGMMHGGGQFMGQSQQQPHLEQGKQPQQRGTHIEQFADFGNFGR